MHIGLYIYVYVYVIFVCDILYPTLNMVDCYTQCQKPTMWGNVARPSMYGWLYWQWFMELGVPHYSKIGTPK